MTTEINVLDTDGEPTRLADPRGVDAIRLEILRHELTTVAEEMGITMRRTARSFTAREGGDYSTALLNARGGLMAQGFANGVHLGSLVEIMRPLLDKFEGDFNQGDIIITNDPYGGLSHLPDIAVVMPVFVERTLVGFSTIDLHHSDIGGRHAGGMGIASKTLYEEGLRMPGVKLYDAGRPNTALMDVIAACVRTPESVLGDLEAQAAACRRGEAGLQELIGRYGVREFFRLVNELDAITDEQMRRLIRSLPDGTYRYAEDFEHAVATSGGGGSFAANDVRIAVEVRVEGDRVTVDYEGSSPQVDSAINVPVGLTKSATYIVFRAICGGEVFANSGLIRPIEIIAPKASVVNPEFPGAVGARGMLMWRLIDVLLRALADAAPGRVPAAGDGGANGMIFTGRNGRILVDWYNSGWGARPTKDGVDGVSNIIMGGMITSLPAESMEREFPVVLQNFGFVPDTEGAGQYRGSLSLRRSWRFLESGTVLLRSCRTTSRPYGLNGGGDGSPNVAYVQRASGEREEIVGLTVELQVGPGDVVVHVQPGGGGYGPPERRDPDLVLRDVRAGKITPERAATVYGVPLDQ